MILYKKPGFQIGLLVTVSFFTFIYIRPKHADIREHGKERKTLIKCQHFNTAGFMTTALLVYQYTLLIDKSHSTQVSEGTVFKKHMVDNKK